ncbi:MAG: GNAT family N-acetyltransferase [Rubrivivax sp.]|nr:GNAT family N-acetyltransferase [Rubrivivax sp.]
MVTVRILGATEHALLEDVAPDVFDAAPSRALSKEFLGDPRHHLAVAIAENGSVVGMASGVHYVHPDKPPQMFINEVGVAPAYEGQGLGRRLLAVLLERASELGCTEAWTATEPDNARAQALYAKAGGLKVPTPFVMFTFPVTPLRRSDDARFKT